MKKQPNNTLNMVYFWEDNLNREMTKVILILEAKQKRLLWLRNLSFDEQSEANYKIINNLELELSAYLGLIWATERLRDAYVQTTAAMAETLQLVQMRCDFYYSELSKILVVGGAYNKV